MFCTPFSFHPLPIGEVEQAGRRKGVSSVGRAAKCEPTEKLLIKYNLNESGAVRYIYKRKFTEMSCRYFFLSRYENKFGTRMDITEVSQYKFLM